MKESTAKEVYPMAYISRLDDNSYTKIPDEIIKKAGLKPGTDIIWLYDEKTKHIIVMENPKNFAKFLRGLGKEIWKDTGANSYVQEERNQRRQRELCRAGGV